MNNIVFDVLLYTYIHKFQVGVLIYLYSIDTSIAGFPMLQSILSNCKEIVFNIFLTNEIHSIAVYKCTCLVSFTKGHFTKVYSIKACGLLNFPGTTLKFLKICIFSIKSSGKAKKLPKIINNPSDRLITNNMLGALYFEIKIDEES